MMADAHETALTDPESIALSEYILRQKKAGRTEIPMSEIEIAISTIKAAFSTLPIRVQRGGRE